MVTISSNQWLVLWDYDLTLDRRPIPSENWVDRALNLDKDLRSIPRVCPKGLRKKSGIWYNKQKGDRLLSGHSMFLMRKGWYITIEYETLYFYFFKSINLISYWRAKQRMQQLHFDLLRSFKALKYLNCQQCTCIMNFWCKDQTQIDVTTLPYTSS